MDQANVISVSDVLAAAHRDVHGTCSKAVLHQVPESETSLFSVNPGQTLAAHRHTRTWDLFTIYGIKNCDTMKKARAWLDRHGVAYAFHDYKTAGIGRGTLESWARAVGWEALLNRAGTTFRALPEKDKAALTETKAITLMLAQPSMIKRPVLDVGGELVVGFKPEQYANMFAATRFAHLTDR